MAAEGAPFIGFLYAGLMIDQDGAPRVIEFNVRLGDPETQPILLRLKSDLVDLIDAAIDGRLEHTSVAWYPRPALGVVIAAHGYPGKVRSGDAISGLDANFGPSTKVFHAGTKMENGKVVTHGGRVLTVCALGSDFADAQARAYAAARKIHFDGMFYRKDIGYRAIARSPT
jgi:phosphoribosylamine--glycine ligase